MEETKEVIALAERLALAKIIVLSGTLSKHAKDLELIEACISHPEMIEIGIGLIKSLLRTKSRRIKSVPPLGSVFTFDVPEHLGNKLYNKARIVEGWFPGRTLTLAPNTEKTAHQKRGIRCRLIPYTFVDSIMPTEVVRRMEQEGLGSATLEQLMGFAVTHELIASRCTLTAPGTMSEDLSQFHGNFPSVRTEFRNGNPELVLSLDTLMDTELYLLGICQD